MAAAASIRRLPRVAVIVPCYNDGATLGETLSSLVGQEPHELVVVDDGSTDEHTLSILEGVRAAGVHVVRQPNSGLAAARMAGVGATRAQYIHPVDADDLLEPGALEALADLLDARPEAAAAWGDTACFGGFDAVSRSADTLDPWLLWFLDEVPGTSMVRRTALEAAGGWRFDGPYEDWDLWMAVAEGGLTGVRLPRVTLRYRWDPQRMSADGLNRHADLLATLRNRHPRLREALYRNWWTSKAGLHVRLLFPLIDMAPGLSGRNKHRLRLFTAHPRRTLAYRRARLAAGRRSQ